MKVAIIHDWLTGMRGGEKVLEVFCELYPDADLFTLIYVPGSTSSIIESMNIKTSYLQKIPGIAKRYSSFLPLFPHAIEGFDLRGYDIVLSSSHCVAKGIIPPPTALHISYIYTPMRYVWDMSQEYFGREKTGRLKRIAVGIIAHYIRMWDVTSSSRVDRFVAISKHVADRVNKYYRREADVIYPPVDCDKFVLSEKIEDFYLIVSAFAPYKRVDLAIKAFNKLEIPLKIIGSGQEERELRRIAGRNIEFLGQQDDSVLREYYSRCKALIFPGEEDFGIVPLEAMASGRPVIAYGKGGTLETVRGSGEKPTGVFFFEQTPDALIAAVKTFEDNQGRFNPSDIRNHALKFDREIFKERIKTFMSERYKEFKAQ